MLNIQRIRIEIQTNSGLYGFDESFNEKVQLIWSRGNTVGKSSILSAIFYGLGMEEIIGGKGQVILSPVFKKEIKSGPNLLKVLESKIYLEINNGLETNTILRSALHEVRSDALATVYNSNYDSINDPNTTSTDYYIHGPNSASNQLGYFSYLEKFLNIRLPKVPNRSDSESKLYLQLIFSGMLIEQKRGWADFFSAMPHFGILEAKKRVIEFILNMDSLENEKERKRILDDEKSLKSRWSSFYRETTNELNRFNIRLQGITNIIEILKPDSSIDFIIEDSNNTFTLEDYITYLENQYVNTEKITKNNTQHIENLQVKLNDTLSNIQVLENNILDAQKILNMEFMESKNLTKRLSIIETDINNNTDALKLQKIGSAHNLDMFKGICPTCKQTIVDSVLTVQNSNLVMAIEENISHLKAQKNVFSHSLSQIEKNIQEIELQINQVKKAKMKLENLARILKNDIFSLDGSYSEESVYKRVKLFNDIERYKQILEKSITIRTKFTTLSKEWKKNREDKKNLPAGKLSENDKLKLYTLKTNFIKNLKNFNFKSITNIDSISISDETFLPAVDGFDLKFDSSASDYIRGIWSFTIALLQTSNELNGNHFGLILFDEPGQHNIVQEDITQLFKVLKTINGESQTFIGITSESIDIKELVKLDQNKNIQEYQVDATAFLPL